VKTTIALILFFAFLVLVVAPSQAAATGPGMAKYERAAEAAYGPLAHCPDGPQVEWVQLDPAGEGADARAEVGGCRMWIVWPVWHDDLLRVDRCQLFLHEWRHNQGEAHPARGDFPLDPRATRACRRFEPRGWLSLQPDPYPMRRAR
jgi:hypothetical protein